MTTTAMACRHERGHIVDSIFFGNRYGTAESRAIFCDLCRCQRWLDIESALAAAQAHLGLIPSWAAEEIARAATLDRVDVWLVQKATDEAGHSLVGLLRVLTDACDRDAGQYVHFGATTQDIQDTAQVLEMRDVLDAVDRQLLALGGRVSALATEYAELVAVGRTHARAALPIGLGLKFAGWLDELHRHAERIAQARDRILVAQLFGGAGSMAGFDGRGQAVIERFAAQLGIGVPVVGWHSARDRTVEFVSTLAMVSGTAGRIADEIRTLSRPEMGELEEAWRPGKVGSSTMPHKRNPEGCEQVVVMARLTAAQATAAYAALIGDHERDARALRIEWSCVPDVSHFCLCALATLGPILDGLIVHPGRVTANAQAVAEQITSERLMFALAEHVGKQRAHELVYLMAQDAQVRGLAVADVLANHPDIARHIDAARLAALTDPRSYIGDSVRLATAAVHAARQWLSTGVPGRSAAA
jgi:adenylosuccinate lyase